MSADRLPLGIFTTDDRLSIRTWDAWLARATGIPAAEALHRPVAEVIPEIPARGLLPVLENVLRHGTVEVLAPALHHYLFACPPSEPSASFAHMQQHVTIGPLRDEGRVAGLIVTVEDVTARVERERDIAARLRTGAAAGEGAAAGDEAAGDPVSRHIESAARLLDQEDWRVRRMAVATLAQHGPAIVDALVRTIQQQHENLSVLSSALDLLAISDIDIVDPLIRLLEAEDANLRIQAALILGERRDRRAIPALMARLTDSDTNVQFHAVEALGRLRATEASDALVEIAERRDFFLAFPAIQALGRVGTASAAPRLVPLLDDELLRAPVIDTLGELGDEEVAVPLVRLLNTAGAPTDVIADALAGLYERYESRYGAGEHIADLVRRTVSAAGTQRMLDAVQRVGSERLSGLARVLGWLEGEAVQRALTRLLGRGSVRGQVVEALVRFGSGVVALLAEQLQAEDLEARQAAAVALGRIGDRRATPALVSALDDPEIAVAAAGALARIGDPAAFEPLLGRLGERDSAVRQAVIAALNSIGHPDMPGRIAARLRDSDPIVRESAVRVAGYFGYPECLEAVLACCRDESEAVRKAAVEQLPFFDSPRVLDPLLNALARDTAPVRAVAASALARVEHPSRLGALRRTLADEDPWVRYMTVKALGAIGASTAVPDLVERLQQDAAPFVRLAAIEVVGRLRPPEALEILEPLTRSSNDDLARAAIAALEHLEQPEALALLERIVRASDPGRRLAAVDALAGRREVRVVEILQWIAAADADDAVVGAAVTALAALGARDGRRAVESVQALVALTAEPARREAAIAALSNLPPRRVPELARGLRHSSSDVRRAAVEALGRMKHPDASRALDGALDDAAPAVRLSAVAELKYLGARTSQKKLLALARTDPDDEVRHAAMMAVARFDGPVDAPGEPR